MLNELVEIRSGYTFRTSIDTFEAGDTEVIQAKDLGDFFGHAKHPRIVFTGSSSHLLKPGNVLLSARGFAKAEVFKSKDVKAVASSSIFVLTPKSDLISSEFIAMFFNSIHGVRAVLELSTGSSVKSITKDNLGRIHIPEISPEKEQALGKAVQAIDDYRELLSIKEIYLDNIRESIISQALKEATS